MPRFGVDQKEFWELAISEQLQLVHWKDAKVILTIRDNEENWFNSWYKFNEKLNNDVNRVNGGLFASYGTFFMSSGLAGQKMEMAFRSW